MPWGTLSNVISKFAPVLYLDSHEDNLPASTDWYAAQVAYQVGGGEQYAPGQWTWSSVPLATADYLVVPAAGQAAIAPGALPTAVAYVHVLPVSGRTDQIDIQYWMFYPQNGETTFRVDASFGIDNEGVMPLSVHWGDWECVVVRVNEAQQVVGVFCSEHSDGQWATSATGLTFLDATHPKVFVARGSHANYPVAGGPFEIGGMDILSVRWSEVDYADGKGSVLDLSQPGRTVLIANDAASLFPGAPAPQVPGWFDFKGQWGQTLAVSLPPATIVQAFVSAVEAAPWVSAPVIYLLNAILAVPALVAGLGALLFSAFFSVEQSGPTSPTSHGLWSATPEFLAFGKDQLALSVMAIGAQSKAPVALVSMTGTDLTCFAVPNPPMVSAIGLVDGAWKQLAYPAVTADSGLAAIATGQPGETALLYTRERQLSCVLSSDGSAGPWSQPPNWPSPASGTTPSVALAGGVYYIVYGGADTHLHYLTTSDWSQFSAEQTVMIAGEGSSKPTPAPVPFSTALTMGPSVAAIGSAVVVVLPVTAPVPELPTTLGAFVSADGAQWSGPYLLPNGAPYSGSGASLVNGSDGRVYCFFADQQQNVRFSSSGDGVEWTMPGKVSGALAKINPTATETDLGMVYVHPGQGNPRLWWNLAPIEAAAVRPADIASGSTAQVGVSEPLPV